MSDNQQDEEREKKQDQKKEQKLKEEKKIEDQPNAELPKKYNLFATYEEKSDYILVIDNYPHGFPTDRIARLEKIVRECIADVPLKTVHFTQFRMEHVEKAIGVILSGSNLNVSSFYYNERIRKRFEPQLELLQHPGDIPILALCFGFHLAAYAYEAQISRMRIPGLGGRIIFIKIEKTDDLITHKNIPVNIHHRDFVSINDCKIHEHFEILSQSQTKRYKMIQYMHHREKPIYALQFHPETHEPNYFHSALFDERIATKTRLVGQEIIENFIWHCYYQKEHSE